jgi:hypothetical protein
VTDLFRHATLCSTFDLVPYQWLHAAFGVIATRGIEPYEVMQALYGSQRRVLPAFSPEGLSVLSVWGRTKAGRSLIVVVRRLDGFDSLIVGAREMNASERKEFQTWLSQ